MEKPPVRLRIAGFLNATLGGVGVVMALLFVAQTLESAMSGLPWRYSFWSDSRDAFRLALSLLTDGLMLASGIGLLRLTPWARTVTQLLIALYLLRLGVAVSAYLVIHYLRPAGGTTPTLLRGWLFPASVAFCLAYTGFLWYAVLPLRPSRPKPEADAPW